MSMKTTCIRQTDADWTERFPEAAALLREGALVAFPTETVYGLGANALDADAVAGIFLAKGRPADNPLIVHIADPKDLKPLVRDIPEVAIPLMHQFWPGALTLVFWRSAGVPDIVTAGLDTVAVRMPEHPIALALIRMAGVPIAAPSANCSGRPSPTTAAHVGEDLQGRIPMIVDGGACEVGVESTVLDVTVTPPMLLRPGGVTREQIEEVIGPIAVDPALTVMTDRPRSPGMKYTHYAPVAPMTLFVGSSAAVGERMEMEARALVKQGRKVGVLCSEEWLATHVPQELMYPVAAGFRGSPSTVAAGIFSALRQFDAGQMDVILAEGLSEEGIGHAVMNRLRKASGGRIVLCE